MRHVVECLIGDIQYLGAHAREPHETRLSLGTSSHKRSKLTLHYAKCISRGQQPSNTASSPFLHNIAERSRRSLGLQIYCKYLRTLPHAVESPPFTCPFSEARSGKSQ